MAASAAKNDIYAALLFRSTLIIIEGLSLLQSIPPTTANKQSQAQKKRGSRFQSTLITIHSPPPPACPIAHRARPAPPPPSHTHLHPCLHPPPPSMSAGATGSLGRGSSSGCPCRSGSSRRNLGLHSLHQAGSTCCLALHTGSSQHINPSHTPG